ncbi:MAG: 4Fe-4S cluster-binding domain-containing protein, partial [Bryobacteraceae bacterium]|nr:4Fe-4S cluster-binding domain-containing protein [Bryobacteraceae bacterium]
MNLLPLYPSDAALRRSDLVIGYQHFSIIALPFDASRHCHFTVQGTTVREVGQRFKEARGLEMLEGVTFSGGEPMQQAEALLRLMNEIRQAGPSVSFGMFSGYTE